MTPARLATGTSHMLRQQPVQPVRKVDRAMRVILGRATVQLAGVELVELPLNPDRRRTNVTGFQPHQFTPAHARESLRDHGNELIVTARQQCRAFCDQQNSERCGNRLLRATTTRPPSPLAPSATSRRRIEIPKPFLNRVGQNEMQRRPPGLDTRLGVASRSLLLLPDRDLRRENISHRRMLERRQQVLLNVTPIVLHGRRGEILRRIPAVNEVTEGDPTGNPVTPDSSADLGLSIIGRLFSLTSGAKTNRCAD